MKRTKLRFLFTFVWIYNIFIQFSLLFNILPKTDGQLSLRWLSVVASLLILSIYLIGDVFLYKRKVFLKIVSIAFSIFSMVYLIAIFTNITENNLIYLIFLIPTLFSAIYTVWDIWVRK